MVKPLSSASFDSTNRAWRPGDGRASAPTTDLWEAVPRATLVRAEQTAALYRNTPMVLAGNVLMACLLAFILPQAIPALVRGMWLAAIIVLCAGRFALWFAYRWVQPPPGGAARWSVWSAWGSAVAGAVWGIGAFVLFVPGQIDFQLLLLFVLIGMGSASVYSLTPFIPAFYAFFLPSIIAAGVVFAREGGTLHGVLATMTAIYLVVTIVFARNMHKLLADSLNLRFENIELVADLKQRTAEAERANVAKSRFLAAASHDLRQPLHALGLLTGSLREEVRNAPRALHLAEGIQNSFEAMDGLFNALLDISRLDAGVVAKEARDFPVQTLLTRLDTLFSPLAVERGLRFTVVASSAWVRSDPALLDRILQNLASNALKYTEAGGVVIGCRRRANTLSIEVLDTGPGIPAQHQQDIFQEYFQLGNPQRDRSKGLGLGLAIVERLSRLLKHRIRLQSEPGRGSRFAIEAPYGVAAALHESRNELIGVDRLQGVRVAIIDDEAAITQAMAELLRHWGCIVTAAGSQAEMLVKLTEANAPPRLLICDYRLGNGSNGVQVIQGIHHALGTKIPTLLITGDTAPDRLREAHASGFELLHKPVQPAKLRQAMQSLLSRAEAPDGGNTV